jgi:hypothetical protein
MIGDGGRVGLGVGKVDGSSVGSAVGLLVVGRRVGLGVGLADGATILATGALVGVRVVGTGALVGVRVVGDRLGTKVFLAAVHSKTSGTEGHCCEHSAGQALHSRPNG